MRLEIEAFVRNYNLGLCIQCGTCVAGCPVKFRSPLNMRRLVRESFLRIDASGILKRQELWACTTCSTCTLRCPAGVKNTELIVGLRSILTHQGNLPPTIRDAFENTLLQGNPWGKFRDRRADWAIGSGIKLATDERTEILFFVGCLPSYDGRVQSIARCLSKIFMNAGLDFGILGRRESCCGNEIRRMGEVALFKKLVRENSLEFKRSGARKIVTISPHCFNTFKNEYPDFGIKIEHYTETLEKLIEAGRVVLGKSLPFRVTYHDPCFLGKQNGVLEPPRRILLSIPGVDFVEMDRSRERSLCCEGGGGRMWTDGGSAGVRNGEIRLRDAISHRADVIATACPFCLITLEDSAKIAGLAEKIAVRDISELVAESAGLT